MGLLLLYYTPVFSIFFLLFPRFVILQGPAWEQASLIQCFIIRKGLHWNALFTVSLYLLLFPKPRRSVVTRDLITNSHFPNALY